MVMVLFEDLKQVKRANGLHSKEKNDRVSGEIKKPESIGDSGFKEKWDSGKESNHSGNLTNSTIADSPNFRNKEIGDIVSNKPQDILRDHFSIREEKADHHYRTELPNIIFDLDLDPYEFKLYAFIKKIAGDNGGCWKSNPNISKDLDISERKIQNALKTLANPFELLGNKPLIKIIERKNDDGSQDSNLIIITDIWRINGDFCRKSEGGGGAPNAGGGVHHMRGGGAPYAPKEDPYNKIHIDHDLIERAGARIEIFDFDGGKREISIEDLFFMATKFETDWKNEEINFIYERLSKHKGKVRDLLSFCKAIVQKERAIRNSKNQKQEKQECQNMKNTQNWNKQSETTKKTTSERVTIKAGTSEHPFHNWKQKLGL